MNRRIGGEIREFGISGLLYNSNVLLYDRQPSQKEESLWSQLEMRAIAGPAAEKGLELELVPFEQTTWGEWTDNHPDSWVLSTNTEHERNYQRNPYGRYFATQDLMFPVNKKRPDQPDLNPKDMLLVVNMNGTYKGYPYKRVVSSAGNSYQITDTVAGTNIRIKLSKNRDNITAHYANQSGKPPVSYMFWFAFQAGFPEADAELYNPDQ